MSVAVAAPHREAVAAADRAVAAGGNALDAALAAAAMLTVVYPHQCAIGGDVIALVRDPAGETTAVIAAGTAPAAIDSVRGGWTSMPRQGAHSVTVPGMVAGWQEISAFGARLGLAPALADAAREARAGSRVSAGLARAIRERADAVRSDVGLAGVFAPDGELLSDGDTFVQPALAETLDRIAADPAGFYRGAVAEQLVAALRDAGGTHSAEDFAGYEVVRAPALAVVEDGRTWTVAPPPSGGALIPGVVAAGLGVDGVVDPARIVSAAVRGVAARAAHLGDPGVARIDLDALLGLGGDEPARIAARRESAASGDTAAVVAIDDEGWSVAIVQSVYFTFGSGLLDPVTGVLFHNRGGAFTLDEASPARLAPGARPPHTLCPLIVEDAETVIVAGCQGGRAQPWILSQLFAPAESLAAPLQETLARPRWIVGDVDLGFDTLTLTSEPGVPEAIRQAAQGAGLPIVSLPPHADVAGHVQLVRRSSVGLEAASDPRADGVGIVFSV